MKNIKNYKNYVTDLLLESIKDGENLNFSKEFLSLLDEIKHPISTRLKNSHERLNDDSTLIDLDDSGTDKISWQEPGRGRHVAKIGKLISKLFGDEFPTSSHVKNNDIESFVNNFKAKRESANFDLVTGSDIEKYYDESNYASSSGSLGHSDMRHSDKKDLIKFYSKNPKVSLLVLFDDDNKVLGRALVWKLSEPIGRMFMDRVYSSKPAYEEMFIDYAISNGWLYLEKQTFTKTKICDPKNDSCEHIDLTVSGIKKHTKYPYMDTFKYFIVDKNQLRNNIDNIDVKDIDIYLLDRTDGGYETM